MIFRASPNGRIRLGPPRPDANEAQVSLTEEQAAWLGFWGKAYLYQDGEVVANPGLEDEKIRLRRKRLRRIRNEQLSASDFTQVPDSPFTEQEKADWATYRQALRDLEIDTRTDFSNPLPEVPTANVLLPKYTEEDLWSET